VTYHAGSTTDDERLLVGFVIIAEGGMEGRLKRSGQWMCWPQWRHHQNKPATRD
jgi:hypothetical protein